VTEEEQAAAVLSESVRQYSEEFDTITVARHAMGEKKYGPVKFMSVNSVEMAMEEVADLANYARYTYIKLALLRDSLQEPVIEERAALGPQSFIPNHPQERS